MVWLSVDSVGGYTYCKYRTSLRWEKDPTEIGLEDLEEQIESLL